MNILNEINYFYYKMALHELQIMNEDDYYNGLSYNSILYINVISQMKDCTASKIADTLNITKSAVTLKLNDLVKQKVITKTQSEKDRRVFYVRLSSDMENTIGIYNKVFNELETDLNKTYTQEQLTLFSEILHTISNYEWRKKNE